MTIIPAIDIQEGKVVRLKQGDFDKKIIYADDPVKIAKKWENAGANLIHIVDLDGAKKGTLQNRTIIEQILKHISTAIQVGGGIRNFKEARALLELGVHRIVLGTKAVDDMDFLKKLLQQYPNRVAVSIDCQDGMITREGWTKTSEITGLNFAKKMESLGIPQLIYTDISRDGMLTGPNFRQLRDVTEAVSIPVIASGGISSLEDIKKLQALAPHGLNGIIIGKALYEGAVDFKTAIDFVSNKGGKE